MNSESLCADRTPAPAAPDMHRVVARLAAWWRDWRRHEHERIEAEALASLGPRTLQDIGVSDEMRLHAFVQRESQYERLTRTVNEMGGNAGRFGPW